MRNRGLAWSLLIAMSSFGCAEASEDGPADATPIIDASTDVPGIEIGNTDTGTTPVDSSAPDTTTAADSASDTIVVDSAPSDGGADTKTDAVADSAASDTAVSDTGSVADTASDAVTAYRHTITIDGTNDFTASAEKLPTTTSSYDAFVTWDDSAIYIGYSGGDVSASSSTKWLFVYFDVDPGASTGATTTEQYATQKHTLPFGADYYYAWRSDGLFPQQKKYASGSWSTTAASATANRSGSYVEIKIPFSTFGSTPSVLGVTTFFLNEASGGEWTYAGLYGTSFTDGYSGATAPKTIANYLKVNLASAASPSSATYKAP